MSRIDPRIPLGVKPFQGPNFAQAYENAASLRDIAQQRKLRGIQMQGAEIELKEHRQRIADAEREKTRKAQLTAIVQKNLTHDADGETIPDWDNLKRDLHQAGFTDEAQQVDTQRDIAETLLVNRRQRIYEEKLGTLREFGKELGDVAKTGNQQKYAKLKAMAYSLGLEAPPEPEPLVTPGSGEQPKASGPPKMFQQGGKEYVTALKDRVEAMVLTEEERLGLVNKRREEANAVKDAEEAAKPTDQKVNELLTKAGFDPATAPAWARQRAVKQVTALDITPPEESEDALVLAAYSGEELQAKPVAKMTPKEKLDAKSWYAKRTTKEKSEFDKRWAKYEEDPEKYLNFVRGGGKTTDKDAIAARNRVMTNVTRMRAGGSAEEEIQDFYADEQEYYSGLGIELPDLPKGAESPIVADPKKAKADRLKAEAAAMANRKTKRIATRAQVEAAATKNGITFEEAKRQVEAAGGIVQ